MPLLREPKSMLVKGDVPVFLLVFESCRSVDPVPNFLKNTHHESKRLQIFEARVQLFPAGAPLARSCVGMTHDAASQKWS